MSDALPPPGRDWNVASESGPIGFVELVRDDVADGFAGIIVPPEGVSTDEAFVVAEPVLEDLPRSDSFAAVPWTWVGEHVGRLGAESEIRPTGRTVVVDGLSLVQRRRDDTVQLHRYVDWLAVYQQLGVVIGHRTPRV